MTLAAIDPRAGMRDAHSVAPRTLLDKPWMMIALGVLLCFVMSWPRAVVIWQDNTFFDTDDALRLVQVRAWLDGQGWFDLVVHRLDPPAGLLMHWSRIVDVPLAVLIRLFELFTTVDASERLSRIVFPLIIQVALVAAVVLFARLLAGPRALVPAMMLTVLSGFTYEQFPPGRIDHHAPQITLLVAMSAALLSALSPRRAWHAAVAALWLVLSLSISLENLPFTAVIVAVLPLVWVFEGCGTQAALSWFAGGLALFAPVLFALTVPPSRYGIGACDAYSVAHLIGFMAGAAGLALLAILTGRLRTRRVRAVALAVVAAAVAACVLASFPACLRDPYANLDPVLKRLWLSHVTEAMPLLAASRLRPDTMTMLGCPLFAGALGLALATWRERGLARLRWSVVLALALVGIAGTFWEIRVAASTQPLAVLGGAWVVTRLVERAQRRQSVVAGVAAACLVLPFSTIAWALVPAGEGDRAAAQTLAQGEACRATTALAPLASLPPGLVFAPIDDGSHLLVDTPHAVVAAPYHRNEAGNRRVLDGFMAQPEPAEAIVRASGARYVALCPGETESALFARVAPDGLGARLVAGTVPDWLRPVDIGPSPFKVFEILPDGLRTGG